MMDNLFVVPRARVLNRDNRPCLKKRCHSERRFSHKSVQYYNNIHLYQVVVGHIYCARDSDDFWFLINNINLINFNF